MKEYMPQLAMIILMTAAGGFGFWLVHYPLKQLKDDEKQH